jgi:hypothetical protein
MGTSGIGGSQYRCMNERSLSPRAPGWRDTHNAGPTSVAITTGESIFTMLRIVHGSTISATTPMTIPHWANARRGPAPATREATNRATTRPSDIGRMRTENPSSTANATRVRVGTRPSGQGRRTSTRTAAMAMKMKVVSQCSVEV